MLNVKSNKAPFQTPMKDDSLSATPTHKLYDALPHIGIWKSHRISSKIVHSPRKQLAQRRVHFRTKPHSRIASAT